ncbi:hypothetical protein [Agrobacterium rosae]|uniref:AbiTii domain-containing protein n=1 Tax=Agrobacterium rosae TaxID=1972867 RepID=UPI00122EB4DA|nr:hypothetical protein [Agrobacterium rosae]KAA3507690.1 hypothetical protein DXM21_24555 [Agrobacterium rosae]KAA3512570.1 hypothetical protein DXM25_24745 [Agrobacterium rosae]MQB51275.1 hypothetical protein [Agrobacterium rosae]
MGLLLEIQNDAVAATSPVTPLLRKCMILAARMNSDLLEDWVRYELQGYPDCAEVPDYRVMELRFRGTFVGSYGRQLTNVPVPPYVVEAVTKNENFSRFLCRQSVSEMSFGDHVKPSGVMRVNLDNLGLLLNGKVYEGYNILSFWGEVPTMSVLGIVDAVKTRVLDFALMLGKKFPVAGEIGGMTIKDEDTKKEVSQIFNNSIYGSVGIVGNSNHSTVNIQINSGNFNDLSNTLSSNGVTEADITELRTILDDEHAIGADKQFGPGVKGWLGKMVGKAASGAWNVGIGAGGALLEAALLQYYGL